jgi:hypothetical protein
MNVVPLFWTSACGGGVAADGPAAVEAAVGVPDATSAQPVSSLTPLAEYTSETLAGLVVLWHPDFRTRAALQARVRDALRSEVGGATPQARAAIAGMRIAVAVESPAAETLGIGGGGHGVSWHRSAQWLEDHGIDAARESVVEIWNSEDFLASAETDPGAFTSRLRGAADEGVCRVGHGPESLDQMSPDRLGEFELLWSPRFEARGELRERARSALKTDLESAWELMSPDARAALRGTSIIVNPSNCSPDGARLRGTAFHPSADWLTGHGYDARRAGAVEVHDAQDYLRDRGQQPLMILHELTHAMTHQASADVSAQLASAYDAALRSGIYDHVDRVGLHGGERGRAYAMRNANEYVAELSEAYFGQNDWYPFTRAELAAFDPTGEAVVESIWRRPESSKLKK